MLGEIVARWMFFHADDDLWKRWCDLVIRNGLYELLDPNGGICRWQQRDLAEIVEELLGFQDAMFDPDPADVDSESGAAESSPDNADVEQTTTESPAVASRDSAVSE